MHKRGFDHEGAKPPQADWLFQVLQDDRDLGGGGRFAGVAGQHPVDQNRPCPFEASFFEPGRF